eukprot:1616009-Amphidinium_carterae.2
MYSGQRRILVQGAVSEGVTTTCGCGHAVDMLHAFLNKSLRCVGRQVGVRKYVDDMVLISSGPGLPTSRLWCYAMGLSPCKGKLWKVWRAVDTQWFAWRNPVQQERIGSFRPSMYRTRALGLPAHVKGRLVKSLFSVGFNCMVRKLVAFPTQHMKDLRASARGALGKGASLRRSAALELMAHGGPSGDPSSCGCSAADLSTVRVWQRRIAAGKVQWPLPMLPGKGP